MISTGRTRRRCGLFALVLVVGAAAGCRDVAPTPVRPDLVVELDEPVAARFVSVNAIFVAEFPVTIADPDGPGGALAFLDTTVVNRSRSTVLAESRRPNANFTYPDRTVPTGGRLTVDAGIGFAPPPPRDEIVVVVRALLNDGRQVERTAPIRQQF